MSAELEKEATHSGFVRKMSIGGLTRSRETTIVLNCSKKPSGISTNIEIYAFVVEYTPTQPKHKIVNTTQALM